MRLNSFALSISLLACAMPQTFATTKGLNQIVTPDVQPFGTASVSYQQQDPNIGNPSEVQLEVGIAPQLEVAYFHGFKPHEEIGGAELGLVAKGPWLLSVGDVGWSSRGGSGLPFVEGGYYSGAHKLSFGAGRSGSETQGIFGYAYQLTPKVLAQVDYQTGSGNSATIGFTYSITPNLSFNPSLYYSNSSPHNTYGYAVLTYGFDFAKSGK